MLGTSNRNADMEEPSKSSETIEAFFSYSHKDERMREKLENHLSTLRREHVIAGWHDRKIMPGTEWKGQIDTHLESSRLILLLISAEFLNSDYCYDVEMKRAIARHDAGDAHVIRIILRPCDWMKSPFGKLQALPRDGKPVSDWTTQDHAFSEVARGIRRVVDEMSRIAQAGHSLSGKPEKREKALKVVENPYATSQENGVYISEYIIHTLERMRFINVVIKSEEEALEDEELLTEYRTHLAEMVQTFLPVVKQLVKAGLLTSSINIEDIDNIQQYSTLDGEPTLAFDNGNIWIDTEFAGGNLRKGSIATPSPKPEPYVKKWGCYMFEGDKEMYCPGCYANGKKSPTTRLSSRFRQCTVCKAMLGSG
jgi:hypothetical protein